MCCLLTTTGPRAAKRKIRILNDTSNAARSAAPSFAARNWTTLLAEYRDPDGVRSVIEIAITLVPFVLLWATMALALQSGFWPALILAVPAAGFLVRLFLIQHDCGHGAFFQRRFVNDWVGRVLGVLTLTPYDVWRRSHAIHHATTGHLDRRGMGDIGTLTVREYQALSFWRRAQYRLYRHPIVMFAIGPAHLFILQHRVPLGWFRGGWWPWISTMATNLAIAAVIGSLIWLVGIKLFLIVHLPIVLMAASLGVWLFYVQHQFADTSWDRDPNWDMHEAALHGSSHYDLPPILRWFTANIGVHHVHHLNSRIPYYRLPHTLEDHPQLKQISRLTLLESLRCVRFTLWDEEKRRLVPFGAVAA